MKRFLLCVLITLLTLGVLLGAGLMAGEDKNEPEETLPIQSLPPETVLPEPETEPKKITVDTVPIYYQTDYPYIRFGHGTMATSGCSVTCLAMVATYLTDQVYTPDQLAYHFSDPDIDHVERLDLAIAQMQLPCRKSFDIRQVMAALNEGNVVITLMNEESFFTSEQHFIVLAGMNEDGKIIVNDPYEPNYTRFADTHMKDGYENGFLDHYIRTGFLGAWIFDKSLMGEDPFLFDASLPEQLQSRYKGYTLSEEDADILARFVMVEAGSQSREVQQAVAEVVLNRMFSRNYPDTVYKVIYTSELQRAVKEMTYAHQQPPETRAAVNAAVYGPYILPEEICFYSPWTKGQDLWGELEGIKFYKTS